MGIKNKKVLYFASTAGHIRNFHTEIIGGLKSFGYSVITAAHGEGVDVSLPFEKRMLSLRNFFLIFRIRRLLLEERPALVVLNTALASLLVRLALTKSMKKTIKVVNFVHGYLFSANMSAPKRWFYLAFEIMLRSRTDTVITMNRYDEGMAKKHRLAGRVLHTAGVGIRRRPEITSPGLIRRELYGEGNFTLCFVGELSRRKNQALLIRTVARLMAMGVAVRLCLVGDGRERGRFSALSKRLGIYSSVIFAGQREDAMDFIRASDLYVSPSRLEGMPLNAIEALSLGKTVLLSRIKGHTDIITDGISGYLFDPHSERELCDAVLRVMRGGYIPRERARECALGRGRSECSLEILRILLGELSYDENTNSK